MPIKPPFRADHVGSFLRPKELLDARERRRLGASTAAELRKIEDEAIRGIVKFQEDLGLQGLTDGEFRRTFFHTAWQRRAASPSAFTAPRGSSISHRR